MAGASETSSDSERTITDEFIALLRAIDEGEEVNQPPVDNTTPIHECGSEITTASATPEDSEKTMLDPPAEPLAPSIDSEIIVTYDQSASSTRIGREEIDPIRDQHERLEAATPVAYREHDHQLEVPRPWWLPAGWEMEHRIRSAGATRGRVDKYYYSPGHRYKFRSRREVMKFIETGQGGKQIRPTRVSHHQQIDQSRTGFL